jgi:TIR domain/PAN domain
MAKERRLALQASSIVAYCRSRKAVLFSGCSEIVSNFGPTKAKGVADIFFSYSRRDRERVGIVRNALAEMGFEVFWDQETPSGSDWDTWIRGELAKSKCAVVFWSATSTVSDNVRHEAVVAKEQRKLISVFLDQLPARDLPMGFYSQQAADLSKWNGDQEDTEWRKFRREFEAKLMPRWVQQKLNDVDAELEGERAKRQTAEAHEKSLRARISTEAKIQQDLKRECDTALTEVGELRAAVEKSDAALKERIAKQGETEQVLKSQCESALAEVGNLKTALQERDATLKAQTAEQADTEQGLQTERDRALAEVAELRTTIEGLRHVPLGEPTKRWLTPMVVATVLLAAAVVGALVFWSISGRKADVAAESIDNARRAAEAKAADAEKARQVAEAKAAEAMAAEAKSGQARQVAEAQAADAEKARQKAAQAIAAQPGDACQTAGGKVTTTVTSSTSVPNTSLTFILKQNTFLRSTNFFGSTKLALNLPSVGDCEQSCAGSPDCAGFSYSKPNQACYLYAGLGTEETDSNFDSGIRSPFKPMKDTGIRGVECYAYASIAAVGDCAQMCSRSSDSCKAFSYSKQNRTCYLYTSFTDLVVNKNFDSGIRQ